MTTPTEKPDSFKADIVIAVPSRGSVRMEWAAMLKMLEPPVNYSWMIRTLIDEEVGDARNGCVLAAREAQAEYILWIDDDVLVPNQGIRRLVYLMEQHPDWDLLSGIYVTKTDPPQPLVFKKDKAGSDFNWKFNTQFEISGCGFGCVLTRMSLFDRVPEPWFRFVRRPQGIHHFEEGEDIYFCRKAREAGATLMADGGLLCGHIQSKTGQIFSMTSDMRPLQRCTPEELKGFTALDAASTLKTAAA